MSTDILGNSIKNGFVLVHISRFKQAIAIHTLQASSHDVKVSKCDTICWCSLLLRNRSFHFERELIPSNSMVFILDVDYHLEPLDIKAERRPNEME
jgi:hypothetical protein